MRPGTASPQSLSPQGELIGHGIWSAGAHPPEIFSAIMEKRLAVLFGIAVNGGSVSRPFSSLHFVKLMSKHEMMRQQRRDAIRRIW